MKRHCRHAAAVAPCLVPACSWAGLLFALCSICPIGCYRKRSSSRMSGVARSRLAEERKAWRKVCRRLIRRVSGHRGISAAPGEAQRASHFEQAANEPSRSIPQPAG